MTLKCAAAPGPSGWRNSYIVQIADTQNGVDLILATTKVLAEGKLGAAAARLWSAAILEPVDGGPAPEPEPGEKRVGAHGRKIRPIGLSEPLIKLAENLAIDAVEGQLRKFLEPSQLGALTPSECWNPYPNELDRYLG